MAESSKHVRKRLRKQIQAAIATSSDQRRTLRILESSNIPSETTMLKNGNEINKKKKDCQESDKLVDKGKKADVQVEDKKKSRMYYYSSSSQSDLDKDIQELFLDKDKGNQKSTCVDSSIRPSTESDLPKNAKKSNEFGLFESSTFSESESDDETEQLRKDTGKKKVRGPTRLDILPVSEHKRRNVKWNEIGQPVGKNSVRLSSTLGVLAKQYIPITISNWKKVDEVLKERLWTLILQKFRIGKKHKGYILRLLGRLWRGYKSELSIKIRNLANCPSIEKELASIKPPDVKSEEWDEFVKIRRSKVFKEKSENMSKVRSKQKHPQTTGRKGFARLERELKKKSKKTYIPRVEVWLEGHKRKDGKPINESVQEKIREIDEDSQSEDSEDIPPGEDILGRVLGPEPAGYVRGRGFGATVKKLEANGKIRGWKKAMCDELRDLKAWKKEMQYITLMSDAPIFRKNQKSTEENVPANVPPVPTSKTSCRLLHWLGTGEFVAEAEVSSTDPTNLVHHVPLGPDCFKVWVTTILKTNVPLFRHSNEFSNLDDAQGSTIAWPHKYIDFN